MNPILVGYETGPHGNVIPSSFGAYAECTKQRLNVIWTLILKQGCPGLQIVIEVKFGNCGPTPALASAPQPKPSSLLPLFTLV
jgi:hypothetical protein